MVGQRKLRELWKYQVEQQRRAERLRNKKESAEFETEEGAEMDSMAPCNEDEQYEQQIIIKSNMIFLSYIFYIMKRLYFI